MRSRKDQDATRSGQSGAGHAGASRPAPSGKEGEADVPYGKYGGSEDQWDVDRDWGQSLPAGHRYGILPGPDPAAPQRRLEPGYAPQREEGEPYRAQRIYGDAGEERLEEAGTWKKAEGDMPHSTSAAQSAGAGAAQPADARIHEALCERLGNAAGLDVENVSVKVVGGVAMLEGSVPEQGMKHRIADMAAREKGVLDVQNRITVRSARYGRQDEAAAGLASTEDDSRILHGRQ